MGLESGDVLEDWRTVVIVPIYKGKGRTECKNYKGILLLSVVIYMVQGSWVGEPLSVLSFSVFQLISLAGLPRQAHSPT